MVEGIKIFLLFFFVIPPKPGSSEEELYRYYARMSICVGVLGLLFLLGTSLVTGFNPFFGGFASAAELKDQEALWQKVIVNQIDSNVFDTRSRQCDALKKNNQAALQFATEKLQEKLSEYQNAAGHSYQRLPDCSEF